MPTCLEQPARRASAQIAKGTMESELKCQRVCITQEKSDSSLRSLFSNPCHPQPTKAALKHQPTLDQGLLQMLQSQVGAVVSLIYPILQPTQAPGTLRRGSVTGTDLIPSFHVWLVVMEIIRNPYR